MTEVLANTDMIKLMLENGITPRLPEVTMAEEFMEAHPDFVPVTGEDNDIVSVIYDCDEEVQCISVEDEEHLYLTDGYIPTHNTANIVFLKSPDDTLLETLSKMSGKQHVVYTDSKTVNIDRNRIVSQTDEKVSYNISAKEVPLLSYNDLANIPKCNSAVFRIDGTPIWNRNQMALPMSHALLKNPLNISGKEFTLVSVPTTSNALDFDLTAMVPDFDAMLEQKLDEFASLQAAEEKFTRDTGLNAQEASKTMDADVYAGEIMNNVRSIMKKTKRAKQSIMAGAEDNTELKREVSRIQKERSERDEKRFAKGLLSRGEILDSGGAFDSYFYEAFLSTRDSWTGYRGVICDDNGMKTADGRQLISYSSKEIEKFAKAMVKASEEQGNRVYSEDKDSPLAATVVINPEFSIWLANLDHWPSWYDEAVYDAMMNSGDDE